MKSFGRLSRPCLNQGALGKKQDGQAPPHEPTARAYKFRKKRATQPAKIAEPGAALGHRGAALFKTIKLIGPVPVSLVVRRGSLAGRNLERRTKMKKKVFAGLAVGMMMFGVVGVANANLLTNGSFEDGDFSGGPVSADVGSTIIPGWTVVNGQLNTVSTWNPWGLAASDGIDFLDLTSYDDSAPYGGITQAITTTVGQQYTFSFDLDNPWSNGPVSVNASVGVSRKNSRLHPAPHGKHSALISWQIRQTRLSL